MTPVTYMQSAMGAGIKFARYTITYRELQKITGSGAKTVDLFTTKPGSIVMGVRVKHSVAFAGGSLSAMTVSVGKSGSATFFTSAFDIFQAVADGTLQETALFKLGQATALPIIATFTPTTDVVAAATAGAVDIDIMYFDKTTQAAPV